MPGLALDLNLDPDLQAACRRLSYRGAYSPSSPRSPPLPTIDESPEEEPTPPPTSPRTTGALYPAPGETLTPTVGEPVATSLSLAPPGQSQSQQAQEAAAATRMLEQRRHEEERAAFAEYQRPAPGETLAPTVGAPVSTWLALAPPAPSQSQQAQEAAAAAAQRMLEQRWNEEEHASFAEYQRQRQQALAAEAGLQQALASQQLMLYTVDGRATSYETKWDELHPFSQGLLLQIEDRIREHRDDSEQLDQCRRFDDLSLCNMSFELDANQITQEAVFISTIMNRDKNSIDSLMTVIQEIMWNTEFAIRSYAKLRPSSATRRPSPFVQQTVARFEDDLGECCKWILELEQLVQMKDGKTFAESLESLSNVMSNVHDYLIHVASKVEHFHQYVETMETQYLNDRRRRGDLSNPFLKANRREAAKQEATDRIIHPMLHLTSPGQPTRLVAAPMIASQLQRTPFPTVATSPTSYPTVPLPSVLPPSSTQTSPAPSINPFSSSGPVLQSMPAASLFRTGIPSSATSLFPVPSGGIRHMLYASG
ncbi:nuclear pore complex protein NUP58-like isoform X2 [Miscanthus floridulus]|uniref:nuclear pore complex protein NUP58-like isoform X2 n=1 Tax=Miscanthus floridulus TaxID=154761 RepID=UPI003457A118